MNTYNKIMLYFWLTAAILIFVIVTIMGIKDGFDVWAFYYILGGIASMAYLSRRWMMKRMERNHEEFYGKNEEAENE
ncbi:MAG: hypothetical protein NXI10_16265 [bacterium]|nr:hypothetical protein [bacterium]